MKKVLKRIVGLGLLLAIGGGIGVICWHTIKVIHMPILLEILVLIVGAVVGMYLQIALHEAGHLVGGLLSGYKFVSYRIGSIMLIRTDSGFALKRMSLAGTGGQCLMAPPDMVDGRIPVMLYNFSGPIANIIAAAVFAVLYFVQPSAAVSTVFLIAAIIGLFMGMMNAIPMRGVVDNDGRNAISLGKNPASMRALWVQLKVNELVSKGMRPKDMPDELFAMPEDKEMDNALVATIAVFRANRLMDAHRFEEADALMERLMTMKSAIPAIHKSLMACDRAFCAAISGNDPEKLLTPADKKIMTAMKSFLSVIRTEYVLALYANDVKKADEMLATFEKKAASNPHAGDIESEREFIDIARAALTKNRTESIM